MKEGDLGELLKEKSNPLIVGSYLVPKKVANRDPIPWVNVYLIETSKKDIVAILDTNIQEFDFNINTTTPLVELIEAKKYRSCKVNATKSEIEKLKQLKYNYCSTLIGIDN